MSVTLTSFMNAHRAPKGSKEWNITGMDRSDMGIYYVPYNEYDEFLKLYHHHVFVERKFSSLLERHATYTPLLIDLDLHYAPNTERVFTDATIESFLKQYAAAFYHFYDYKKPLRFFVMWRPTLTQDTHGGKPITKDGVHIVCGDITVDYMLPFALRHYCLGKHIMSEFKDIVNSHSDAFDLSVIKKNNWLLYGAAKDSGREPYIADYCYLCHPDGRIESVDWDETDEQCIRLFSLHWNRESPDPLSLRASAEKEWETLVAAALPTDTRVRQVVIPAAAAGAADDDSDTVRTDMSEHISRLLKTTGLVWNVSDYDGGYKLEHNTNECLVTAGYQHSQQGHSCIIVHPGVATLSCFSHNTKRLPKTKSVALWQLLAGEEKSELIDDLYACKKFVECMGDEIHREGDCIYVFNPATGMWNTDETELMAAVHRHKDALVFTQTNANGIEMTYNYGGCTKNIKNMLVHLKALLPNGTFISSNIDAALPYLLFEDGIFHIPTKTFEPGFDKTKVFSARIPRKFPVTRDAELEALVNDKLFVLPVQNERVGQYLKMRLARSIAGCYRDKKFVCVLGEADCSKGSLTHALGRAFGEFITEYNANYLKYNAKTGADEAKRLSWLFPIRNSRIAISNEMRMDKTPIDGNLLKSLSSGGDEISARQNFKDESSFVLRTSFFFMGNDLPEITPKDSGIETRVRVVRFNKRFVATPTLPNELPADPTIKDKFNTDEWKNALFWLIVDAYGSSMTEPAEVCEETREWVPSGSTAFRSVLEEHFVINVEDKSDDNFTAAREIITFVKEQGLNMSDNKIGRELAKLGLTKDDKRVDGKTIRVWKGIKY